MRDWKSNIFEGWKVTRQKGRFHYVTKRTIIVAGSVLLGTSIGFTLFDKVRSWSEFFVDLSIAAAALLMLSVILHNIIWVISEALYRKECNRKEHI